MAAKRMAAWMLRGRRIPQFENARIFLAVISKKRSFMAREVEAEPRYFFWSRPLRPRCPILGRLKISRTDWWNKGTSAKSICWCSVELWIKIMRHEWSHFSDVWWCAIVGRTWCKRTLDRNETCGLMMGVMLTNEKEGVRMSRGKVPAWVKHGSLSLFLNITLAFLVFVVWWI